MFNTGKDIIVLRFQLNASDSITIYDISLCYLLTTSPSYPAYCSSFSGCSWCLARLYCTIFPLLLHLLLAVLLFLGVPVVRLGCIALSSHYFSIFCLLLFFFWVFLVLGTVLLHCTVLILLPDYCIHGVLLTIVSGVLCRSVIDYDVFAFEG